MQRDNATERWVEHLNVLAPVQGLIHVGAGANIAKTFYAEWPLAQVLLLEADENSAAKLSQATQHRNGWVVSNTLVSSNPEACDFYIASNLNESSLIAPELLTPLWKNLKTKEVRSLEPTPLSALIAQQITAANWLVIESLTALDVLKSAAAQLNQFDVICVRALRSAPSADLKEAAQEAIHHYLVESVFTLLHVEEEVQPNVINALYTRDWKKIQGVKDAQCIALQAEQEAQVIALQTEKEAHQKVVAELKAQMDEAVSQHQKALAEKEAQAKSASENAQALLAEKEAHQKVVAELKAQMDEAVSQHQKAIAEKEAQAKLASEKAQTLLAEETNKNAQLLQAEKKSHEIISTELAAIKKERDEQAHWNQKHKDWAESLKREIETLKKDYAEGERAQNLALKLQAKAQVDLEHLQTQYQQKISDEQKLIELIKELKLRLQAAANYYHELQIQHPEFILERSISEQR